jgi:hypothetical protein
MEFINEIVANENYTFLVVLVIGGLTLWFLPAILALFFNRKHFKYILLACIPAGFSFIAWGGVIVWATTGKVIGKYVNKVNAES